MKKNILTSLGLIAFFAVATVSLNVVSDSGITSVYANTGGSPFAGLSNSPGDANSCLQCHNSFVMNSGSGTSAITSTIPASGYVPGDTYTITGSVSETGINKFGFEMTAEKDADNSKVGSVIITDGTKTQTSGSSAVTHKSAGVNGSGSNSWSFDWTAPIAGTGDVSFYGAFNAANINSSSSGDNVYASSLAVSESLPPPPVQAKVSVDVQSNSFTPNSITINVGDTIEWTNTGGSHNVNGTTGTYPSNPESFGNSVGAGWTYSHVFNVAGNYDFRCDPHFGQGMTGTIVVGIITSVVSSVEQNDFNFYPNPVKSSFEISTTRTIDNVVVYNLAGKKMKNVNRSLNRFNVSYLASGIYFVQIESEGKVIIKKIVKE
tara:strand:+ start:2775 stop:3902 length:1128 start_codon:yes stop_codon:yes gene_type:complete